MAKTNVYINFDEKLHIRYQGIDERTVLKLTSGRLTNL